MLSQNFKEKVKEFISNDQGYSFMNSIKGTPAYLKKVLTRSISNGKTVRSSNIFHNTVMH